MKSKFIHITTILLLVFWGGISFALEEKCSVEIIYNCGVDDSMFFEALAKRDSNANLLSSATSISCLDSGFEIQFHSTEKSEMEYGNQFFSGFQGVRSNCSLK